MNDSKNKDWEQEKGPIILIEYNKINLFLIMWLVNND